MYNLMKIFLFQPNQPQHQAVVVAAVVAAAVAVAAAAVAAVVANHGPGLPKPLLNGNKPQGDSMWFKSHPTEQQGVLPTTMVPNRDCSKHGEPCSHL